MISTTEQRIADYFSSKRVNSSLLKKLWEEPFWIKWKLNNPEAEDEETSAFRVGSAIDTALTDSENFTNLYHVTVDNRPWGLMGKFIDLLPLEIEEDSDLSLYEEAYEQAGYRISLEAVVKQLWSTPRYKYFFQARKAALGKQVLSQDEYNMVVEAKSAILSDKYAQGYFVNNDPNIKLYHQVPIYFEYMGIECKAMLDGLILNSQEKTALLFDLKTMSGKVSGFPWQFLKYKYYLQGTFYFKALEALKEGRATTPVDIDLDLLKECELVNPRFVVVNKHEKKSFVRIYNMSDNDLLVGIQGGQDWTGCYFPGVDELLKDLKWHLETDQWDLPRRVYENNGTEELNVFLPTYF